MTNIFVSKIRTLVNDHVLSRPSIQLESGVCCPYRTLEEVKIMYRNSKAAVKGKIDLTRKTGGGGMICISQSEEVEQLLKMSMDIRNVIDYHPSEADICKANAPLEDAVGDCDVPSTSGFVPSKECVIHPPVPSVHRLLDHRHHCITGITALQAQAGRQSVNNMTRAGRRSVNNMTGTGRRSNNNMPRAGRQSVNNMTRTGRRSNNNMTSAGRQSVNNMTRAGRRS
ncbi:hypothetical protein MAR_037987, partial [Mya arenaria]